MYIWNRKPKFPIHEFFFLSIFDFRVSLFSLPQITSAVNPLLALFDQQLMCNRVPQLDAIEVAQIRSLFEDVQLGVADHSEVVYFGRHQLPQLVLVELLDQLLLRMQRGVMQARLLLKGFLVRREIFRFTGQAGFKLNRFPDCV